LFNGKTGVDHDAHSLRGTALAVTDLIAGSDMVFADPISALRIFRPARCAHSA